MNAAAHQCVLDFAPVGESVADVLLAQAFLEKPAFRERFLEAVDPELRRLPGEWHVHFSVKVEDDEFDIVLCNRSQDCSRPVLIVIENKRLSRFPPKQFERHRDLLGALVDCGAVAKTYLLLIAPSLVTPPKGAREIKCLSYEQLDQWMEPKSALWTRFIAQVSAPKGRKREDPYVRQFLDQYCDLARRDFGLEVDRIATPGACSTWCRITREAFTICHKLNDGQVRVDITVRDKLRGGRIACVVEEFAAARGVASSRRSSTRTSDVIIEGLPRLVLHRKFDNQEADVRRSLTIIHDLWIRVDAVG